MSEVKEDISPPEKKNKMNEEKDVVTVHSTLENFKDFEITKILNENSDRKNITCLGKFKGYDGDAIVLLEKKCFVAEKANNFFCEQSVAVKSFTNDIYGNYETIPPAEFCEVKTTVIHPATQVHIEKYSRQQLSLISETPEIYNLYTSPAANNVQLSIQWVQNILDHTSEANRIVYEDDDSETGFILLPDLKWDGKTTESLYLLGIVRKEGLSSIRDLTAAHLPLLKNVQKKGLGIIKQKYGLDETKVRIYFHYRPSFYHLHLHFISVQYDAPGYFVEKAHLLSSVISNLELLPDYYQKVSLPLIIRQNEPIYKKLVENGLFVRATNNSEGLNNLFIFMETRPRLRSCQIHVKFKNPLCLDLLKIIVTSTNEIRISTNCFDFTIFAEDINFALESITNLVKSEHSFSFRIRTNPLNCVLGSVTSEVILSSDSNKKLNHLTIEEPITGENTLKCRTCSTIIGTFNFKRVLPLPSSTWSEIDWFCHKQHSTNIIQSTSQVKQGDLLFNSHSWYINSNDLNMEIITCKNCLKPFGSINDGAVSLWISSIGWNSDNFTVIDASNIILSNIIHEFSVNNIPTRLLLTCEGSDPLFLWPLNSPIISYKEISTNENYIHLPSGKISMCVLYSNDDSETPDVNVLNIPSVLYHNINTILKTSAHYLPEHCNTSNGLNVGYYIPI